MTYHPEHPPFHLLYRDKIPSIENKARNEECTQAEGSVVGRKQVAQCAEKALNGQKRYVIEDMERPEGIPRTMKIRHKVNDGIIDQNSNGGEGKI
jgi:hypothetical protein